ncbi:MAG: hypothetical protein R6W73_09800 [Candidatus Saliniplasma sp.]
MEASNLKIYGKVMNFQGRDKMIAKFSRSLEISSSIFDNRNREIGEIEWIFGPVDDPYYEIKTQNEMKRLSMINQKIYAEEE